MSCNGKIESEDELIIYMDEFSRGKKINEESGFKKTERLLETDNVNNPKPNYGPEIDDLEPEEKPLDYGPNDRGIDDGFLPERPKNKPPKNFPSYPPTPQPHYPGFIPGYLPGDTPTPDVNVYQQKKTIAQGMMDLALISANANQFRYVLQSSGNHPYYYPSLAMIGMSLILQVAIGIGLIWNSRYNVKVDSEMCKANRASNWTIIGIFSVTVLNVFISSFGVVDSIEQPSINT
ncbi:ninjurin-A-like [Leptopilina boulardi]|uniref:ninjurin-A-like n=1 Tax=Leptopilina boulardi TaxID=63433 RepID=UPI0021F5FAB1|nr:ninjurin-A-like [Leptopilina boulardi]